MLTPDLQRAIDTAIHFHEIQRKFTRPECLTGSTIVAKQDGRGQFSRYAVYKSSAWTPPTSTPILPWSPPTGDPVATVDLDGTVHLLTLAR